MTALKRHLPSHEFKPRNTESCFPIISSPTRIGLLNLISQKLSFHYTMPQSARDNAEHLYGPHSDAFHNPQHGSCQYQCEKGQKLTPQDGCKMSGTFTQSPDAYSPGDQVLGVSIQNTPPNQLYNPFLTGYTFSPIDDLSGDAAFFEQCGDIISAIGAPYSTTPLNSEVFLDAAVPTVVATEHGRHRLPNTNHASPFQTPQAGGCTLPTVDTTQVTSSSPSVVTTSISVPFTSHLPYYSEGPQIHSPSLTLILEEEVRKEEAQASTDNASTLPFDRIGKCKSFIWTYWHFPCLRSERPRTSNN